MFQVQALYLTEENNLRHCQEVKDHEAMNKHDVIRDYKKAAKKKRQV